MNTKEHVLQEKLDEVATVLRNHQKKYKADFDDALERYGTNCPEVSNAKACLDAITKVLVELKIEIELKSFYFTFGSAKQYPYTQGQYVIVKAQDKREAARKYMKKYPNPNPDSENIVNCADYYNQMEWDERIKKYYGETPPAEIIE